MTTCGTHSNKNTIVQVELKNVLKMPIQSQCIPINTQGETQSYLTSIECRCSDGETHPNEKVLAILMNTSLLKYAKHQLMKSNITMKLQQLMIRKTTQKDTLNRKALTHNQ